MQHSNPPHSQRLKTVFITHIIFCFVYKTCVFLHVVHPFCYQLVHFCNSIQIHEKGKSCSSENFSLLSLYLLLIRYDCVQKCRCIFAHSLRSCVCDSRKRKKRKYATVVRAFSFTLFIYFVNDTRHTHTHRIYLCKKRA